MKSFAIAMVGALGFLLATVPAASAQQSFQCTGTISDGSTINSSLVVPANTTCVLDNVTVIGNVQVGTGAVLQAFPGAGQKVTIDGNIVADQCKGADLKPSGGGVISVEGNVNFQNCRFVDLLIGTITISGNFVCANSSVGCEIVDSVVQGNLAVENNSGLLALRVEDNQISGNVDVSGNTGMTPVVGGNAIGGNLRCSDNNPAPVDNNEPNTVSGHKLGQCTNL